MLYKLCSYCHKKYPSNTECNCESKREASAKRQRYYDVKLRNKERTAFYHSPAWIATSHACRNKFLCGVDIYALYKYERYIDGILSHHIDTLEDNPARGLDIINLIYLSDSSHKEIHRAYNTSPQSKADMQAYLFGLVDRFEQDYM